MRRSPCFSGFLCAPQALYAVNEHVNFVGHATTFEVFETELERNSYTVLRMKASVNRHTGARAR